MVMREIALILGRPLPVDTDGWRKGDQLYFVADTRKLRDAVGWMPSIGWRDGLRDLSGWLAEQHEPVRDASRTLLPLRSEGRRDGKEGVSSWTPWWSPDIKKKKND